MSGVSTTDTSVTLSDTVTSLSCGPKYDYPTTVSTLEESSFTSTSGLSVQVTQTHEATAKGVKICYQPAIALPPPPVLLKKCSSHVPAPCYRSITEVSGSVVASFTVPSGDPRFWVGSGLLGLKTFSPTSGAPGTTVTIKGTSLGTVTAVAFGGHASPDTNVTFSKSFTSLTVVVPSDV